MITKLEYTTIAGRAPEIIEDVMNLTQVPADPETQFTLRLVVEELVVNIVNYAYGDGGDGPLRIELDSDHKSLTLTIADNGTPFNPLEQATPDTNLSAEERSIGGLGIFLVREMMDTVDYKRVDGANVITATKNIKPS